ncbi:uncharacterized protein LOC126600376 [Malus sylvestris]|uniref:uncharacterized protein LOC126600376 n=1 Tax=Malus sylvestris TaxID=3752 RepID=UPI0021AC2577|nr:uncharacterized protein LOC126600376 [Malus sylvestris]
MPSVDGDVANLSRSPFTYEIEQKEPPWKFNLPHFTLFNGDEDPDRHLMHYQSVMALYTNNDALMCKIFATILKCKNFNELSLAFTKEYSSYHSIKKKSDHLFNMKKDQNESLRTYGKRFKMEKAKIVGWDNSIVCSTFRKGLSTDHPLFGELIMGENLSLTNYYALPRKDAEPTQKKANDKSLNNKSKPVDRRMDQSPANGGKVPKTYTKFSVTINQILRDLKDKPWFKSPPPVKDDTYKMDRTKYCIFHRGLGHITNDCTTWRRYLEQLVKEG